MNTTTEKANTNLIIAEAYYSSMADKDFETMASHLHPNVQLLSPLAKKHGKDEVVEAAKNFSAAFEHYEIKAKFSAENQIMMAYDFSFPEPIGTLRAAVLMTFENQLITQIELFYDGRVMEPKKDKIFSS